jgi:hypothetical protein
MTEPRFLVELYASGIFVSGRLRHPRKRLHPIAKTFRREPGKRNGPNLGRAEAAQLETPDGGGACSSRVFLALDTAKRW